MRTLAVNSPSFYLVIEATLTVRSIKLFRKEKSTWGKKRLNLDRALSSDAAENVLEKEILKRLCTREKIPESARVKELHDLVSRLVACDVNLAADSDSGNEISGKEVDRKVGLSEMRSRWRTYTAGNRLHPWGEWIKQEAHAPDDVTAAWGKSLSASWGIVTVKEIETVQHVEAWRESSRYGSVVLVSGRLGTGKTWLLARVAERSKSWADVYYLDDRTNSTPNLRELVDLSDLPVIVLVDDLRQHDQELVIREAQNIRGLLVLASAGAMRNNKSDIPAAFSLPRDILQLVHGMDQQLKSVALLDNVESKDDQAALASAWGRALSRGLAKTLGSGNIRMAVRKCSGEDSNKIASILCSLIKHPSTEKWMRPLLWSSVSGARIPYSLLRLCAGAEYQTDVMPAAVDAVALQRKLTDGEVLLFVEEDSAQEAMRMLLEQQPFQEVEKSFQVAQIEGILSFIDAANPKFPSHRAFLRRLMRSITPESRYEIVEQRAELLLAHATLDGTDDLAYSWIRVLGSNKLKTHLSQLAESIREPRSASEVVVLASAVGEVKAYQTLFRHIPFRTSDVLAWELAFSRLQHMPPQPRRELLRLTLCAVECSQVSLNLMLHSNRIGGLFVDAVARTGSPTLRKRTLRRCVCILSEQDPPLQLVDPALGLAERCHTQKRSKLALKIMESVLDGHVELGDRALAEQEVTAINNDGEDYIGQILSVTLKLSLTLSNDRVLTASVHNFLLPT